MPPTIQEALASQAQVPDITASVPPMLSPTTDPVSQALMPNPSQVPNVIAEHNKYLQDQYNQAIDAQNQYRSDIDQRNPEAYRFGPDGRMPTAGTDPSLASEILQRQQVLRDSNTNNAAQVANQQSASNAMGKELGGTNNGYNFATSTKPSSGTLPTPEELGFNKAPQPAPSATANLQSPDYLKQISDAMNKQVAAIGSQQAANTAVAKQAGNIEEVKGNAATMQQAEAMKAASTVQAAFNKANDIVNQQMDQRKEALQKYKEMLTPEALSDAFRPRGIFEGKSTGQTILGALAIALGGVGAAGQGSGAPNQALGIIFKQLDKENEGRVNAFKTGLVGQQNLADEAGKDIGYARQQYQDASTNALQNKALQIEAIQAKLEHMVAPYKGEGIRQQAAAVNAGLEQEKQKTIQQQAMQMRQMHMMASLQGMSEKDIMNLPAAAQATLGPEIIKNAAEKMQRLVPGYGYADNAKLAEDFNKQRAELEGGYHDTMRIIKYAQTYNKFDPDSYGKMQTELGFLLGKLKEPMGYKTMTEGDQKFLKTLVGNPNDFLSLKSVNQAKLQSIADLFKNSLNERAVAAGFRPQPSALEQKQQLGVSSPNFKK